MKVKQTRAVIPITTVNETREGGTNKGDLESEFKEGLIGNIIKQARERKHVTQERLAEKLGINKSNISKIENNSSSIRMETFFKVMHALDTKVTVKIEFEK